MKNLVFIHWLNVDDLDGLVKFVSNFKYMHLNRKIEFRN